MDLIRTLIELKGKSEAQLKLVTWLRCWNRRYQVKGEAAEDFGVSKATKSGCRVNNPTTVVCSSDGELAVLKTRKTACY